MKKETLTNDFITIDYHTPIHLTVKTIVGTTNCNRQHINHSCYPWISYTVKKWISSISSTYVMVSKGNVEDLFVVLIYQTFKISFSNKCGFSSPVFSL